jgi:hypothetical protein
MESIMVGQSDLGRWFRDADLNQPLNGYYGNSSGHVAYYYNGYQGSGNGWCEYY